MVEAPHRRHHKGKLCHLRIDIGVPGRGIAVNRVPDEWHAHEDVFIAIRGPFDAAARQLEDHWRKAAGRVKAHEVPPHGKVSALQAYEGYGFVTLTDGQEVYLHKNAVVNGAFNKIAIGDEVRVALIEGESDKAPRGTTVIPIGKHYLAGR